MFPIGETTFFILFTLSLSYIRKKWTRDDWMRIRWKSFVWVMMIFLSAFFTVAMTHHLLQKKNLKQEKLESLLPYGNYLPDSENPLIRVVLKTSGFQGIAHSEVQIRAESGIIIEKEQKETKTFTIKPDSDLFKSGSIRIKSKKENEKIEIISFTRGCGVPSYRGILELYSTAEGIVIVNEVPLEEYLCGVVPSEMSASFEMEALKCQAVCARSYAYCQMLNFSYPEYQAHVDDSVSFQVYGNSGEKKRTTRAVMETAGEKLWYNKEVVKTYYYSTSSGHSTDIRAWGSEMTEAKAYLKGIPICDENKKAYEKEIPWYRWKASIPENTLRELLELNTGKVIGNIERIEVTKRGTGDVALQLSVKGSEGTIVVETENKIRTVLGGEGYHIEKQDGTVVKSTKLLPSAFFTIAKIGETYIIEGGGYGHGIGMSQNGANEMAKVGKDYKSILQFFYSDAKVE